MGAIGAVWGGLARSAPFGSLMAKKRRPQSRHRRLEARSSCARSAARTHTVPCVLKHGYSEYSHGHRQPAEEVRSRTNDQTSHGRFGGAVETKRCAVYNTRAMRRIPCGMVSHVAKYPMQHGKCRAAAPVLHPMRLRHGISENIRCGMTAGDLSSCTHESEFPKVS